MFELKTNVSLMGNYYFQFIRKKKNVDSVNVDFFCRLWSQKQSKRQNSVIMQIGKTLLLNKK